MFNWKFLLSMALPYLELAGQAKINEDENTTGKDDAIGEAMIFASKLLKAIVLNQPLPKAPDSLT
jgi:hypothetical protein